MIETDLTLRPGKVKPVHSGFSMAGERWMNSNNAVLPASIPTALGLQTPLWGVYTSFQETLKSFCPEIMSSFQIISRSLGLYYSLITRRESYFYRLHDLNSELSLQCSLPVLETSIDFFYHSFFFCWSFISDVLNLCLSAFIFFAYFITSTWQR